MYYIFYCHDFMVLPMFIKDILKNYIPTFLHINILVLRYYLSNRGMRSKEKCYMYCTSTKVW